jgi:transposase
MEVLWLKANGLPHAQIATLAGVSRSSVQRYLDEYHEGGLDRARCFRWRGSEGELAKHTFSLEEHFWQHPPHSAKQAQAVIQELTGVRRGLTQVREFLKYQLGLRWAKVGAVPCPPKKAPDEHARAQAAFLAEKLQPRLEQARQGKRVVFFVDAAHFVFAPFLGFVWCLCRLFVRASAGRKRYSVLAALNAVTHEAVRVTTHATVNAESVGELLRQVAARCVGVPVTLVLDNARYQHTRAVKALAASLGIELLYLPSYSPNLNLIERLWRFVRKEVLDATYFEKYEQFTAGIDRCLEELTTTHKKKMESLLTHNFQTFENVSFLAA